MDYMNEWKERTSLSLSQRILTHFTSLKQASTTRVKRHTMPLATRSEKAHGVMVYLDSAITNKDLFYYGEY